METGERGRWGRPCGDVSDGHVCSSDEWDDSSLRDGRLEEQDKSRSGSEELDTTISTQYGSWLKQIHLSYILIQLL